MSAAAVGSRVVAVIDNYDSFTYNLVQYLGELGARVAVWRNDELTVAQLASRRPAAVVLSPGPCTPDRAGICIEAVRALGAEVPILGVCLGHQAIGQAYGARVVRAPRVMHGKVSAVRHDGRGIFAGVPEPLEAARYHSLVVERNGLPDELVVTATSDDGVIMGLRHRQHPVVGVQFHPESVATPQGRALLHNFLLDAGVPLAPPVEDAVAVPL